MPDPTPAIPLDQEGVEAAKKALGYSLLAATSRASGVSESDFDRDFRAAITAYEAHRAANLPQDPRPAFPGCDCEHHCDSGCKPEDCGCAWYAAEITRLSLLANLPSQRDDGELGLREAAQEVVGRHLVTSLGNHEGCSVCALAATLATAPTSEPEGETT